MKRPSATYESGFTIVELVACAGLLVVMLAVATVLLRPKTYDAQNRNAKRWLGVAQTMQAVTKYYKVNGTLPAGISGKTQMLGSNSGQLNLCSQLVPRYIKDVQVDPLLGYEVSYGSRNCLGDDTAYSSNYTIVFTNGRVTVAAPGAELHERISVSRVL